jgi:glyoxylase-like metal-dependent hydrolase (beta-lactamase superfamily II)
MRLPTWILAIAGVAAAQDLRVLPVQGNVYAILGPQSNSVVQVGSEGVLIVDAQSEAVAPKVIEEVRKVSQKPVLEIFNTHLHADHTGGNAALAKLGATPSSPAAPAVVAHENVFNAMSQDQMVAPNLWPTVEYYLPQKDYFANGEAVVLYHMPNAHTDGDSVVFFRRSDVIATGDIFSPAEYPEIDLAHGGSINGLIAALNRILELTVPGRMQEGGTKVVPGHGRICEEAEVVEYRDMVTIVRDRVQDMRKRGMTLDRIKAARPTHDYDSEYGASANQANYFVESVYKSLASEKGK